MNAGRPQKKFERRADARPDEVLAAALDLFLRDGFEATRMEDIGKAAGISKATVYLYFPSKQALLEGIVRRSIAPIPDEVGKAVAKLQGSPKQALRMALSIFAKRLSEPQNAAIPMLILREAGRFPEMAAMYRHEVMDKGLAMLSGILRKGMTSGDFRATDPDLAVRSVIGPVLAHLLMARVFDIGDGSSESMQALFANHIDLLLNGLEA